MVRRKNFRSFEDARKFVHGLNLEKRMEWVTYCKSDKKPVDIPATPHMIYKNKGWINLGDWLGTGFVNSKKRTYVNFDEFKKFIRQKKIKTQKEFREFAKNGLPKNYPSTPDKTYKRLGTWTNWNDLCGTESRYLKNPPTYTEFKKWIRKQGIKSGIQFRKIGKKNLPQNYPTTPARHYEKLGQWKGWNELCGTESQKLVNPPTYEEFKKWIRKQGIKSGIQFREFAKNGLPKNYPKVPDEHYKRLGRWVSWADFLGTQNRKGGWLSFDDARKHIRKLKLKNQKQFFSYRKTMDPSILIPRFPDDTYKGKGWKGWPDFLDSDYVPTNQREYKSFDDARKYVHSLKFKNQSEWNKFAKSRKKPKDIPADPWNYYKKQKTWTSFGDWLGTGTLSGKQKSENYLSWKEAKKEYHNLQKKYGIKNKQEWIQFARTHKKLLDDLKIPAAPWQSYTKNAEWERSMKNG